MSIIPILQYPDSRLRTRGHVVSQVNDKIIQQTIDDMLETLAATEHCAALAATQLDIKVPPAITVINNPEDNKTPLCLINPQIIEKSGECKDKEGCMSIYPGDIAEKVLRAEKVIVHAFDRSGQKIIIEASDFLARCLQHEIDHLNGILFIDYLSPLKRERLEKKIKKL